MITSELFRRLLLIVVIIGGFGEGGFGRGLRTRVENVLISAVLWRVEKMVPLRPDDRGRVDFPSTTRGFGSFT
jgi:hypothetical protein